MTRSTWTAMDPLPTARLDGEVACDVCVVGAGIAGVSTAHLLARDGHDVVLLERDAIGAGETMRTTAQLVTALDRGWSAIVRTHGVERARLAADSHRRAIAQIEDVIRAEDIACGFARIPGFLFGGTAERRRAEADAAREVGLAAEIVADAPFAGGEAVRFDEQAQFDPAAYVGGLAWAALRGGVQLFQRTAVDAIRGTAGNFRVATSTGATVRARSVVVATNAPIAFDLPVTLKQAAYRTYVIAAEIPHGALPVGLYWDLEDPFHYVRLQLRPDQPTDLLLVGGEDHRTGQEHESASVRWGRLEAWTRGRLPALGPVAAGWSGQVQETMDGLAFLGRLSPGVYVITGDGGDGMTHATVGAMLIRDDLAGRANPWADLYDPHRLRLRAGSHALRENANTATQMLDYVTGGDVDAAGELAPGTGAILRRGLTKIAGYRDADGQLHERSAICPHLGCVVRWNAAETSWDCPCHGSRFDPLGRVLNGPARRGLARIAADTTTASVRPALEDGYRFEGVILDVDGTLLDSNEAHARAWVEAFAEAGIATTVEVVQPLIGMGGDHLLPRLVGVTKDSPLGRDIDRRRGEIFRERHLQRLHPFPRVRELLETLRARGQRLVIATSAKEDELDGLLDRAGVADLIDERTSSGDVSDTKPAPDIVEVAIKQSGLDRAALVMIGDTPYDVEAGTRAGIPVLAFRCGGWTAAELAGAARVFDDPAALLVAIEQTPLSAWFDNAARALERLA